MLLDALFHYREGSAGRMLWCSQVPKKFISKLLFSFRSLTDVDIHLGM
jgi:hypothetical protein